LRASSDRAILAITGGSIFEGGQQFFHLDNDLMALGMEME
jgi:hypothetical protein